MIRKRLLAGVLSASLVISAMLPMVSSAQATEIDTFDKKTLGTELSTLEEVSEITLEKSLKGNPLLGFDGDGNLTYGGDQAAMVEGDTVYLYTSHDIAPTEAYKIPEWLCYSSKDMVNWTYESVIMKVSDISWADDIYSGWASQVAEYQGMYYFYYCTWNKYDRDENGYAIQAIGVATSDSPTGPFEDIGYPLVIGSTTTPHTSNWNDIDPTVWIETDETGEDHRYLAWGNGLYFICELNEDMISVKDQNDDYRIDMNDIIQQKFNGMRGHGFTEAAWLYRQQDEKGNYYGPYYTFFAADWREQMAYATTDDISSGEWDFGGILMPPSPTSNTHHPAVIDFKGKTYLIYHNGKLSGGSGFRRVACVEEFTINEDGSIDPILETATGISGIRSEITNIEGIAISHESFVNPLDDIGYPISKSVGTDSSAAYEDARWAIVPGKADTSKDSYVSLEAYNKPGLYLTANASTSLVLTQDATGTAAVKNSMTFRTLKGLNGTGVTFESVAYPGYYLTSIGSELTLSNDATADNSTFFVKTLSSISATKTRKDYKVGEQLNLKDIKVKATYIDGMSETITEYTTNASSIDMSKTGTKTLTITYTKDAIIKTFDIPITVNKTLKSISVTKVLKKIYYIGDTVRASDFQVTAEYNGAPNAIVANFTTNVSSIDMNKPGTKTLTITYMEDGITKTCNTSFTLKYAVPKKDQSFTKGNFNYKVSKSAEKNGTVTLTSAKKKTNTSVTIPATVKINGFTFNVTAIGDKAFASNRKLKNVTVGTNITSIGKNAFDGCKKLQKITVKSTKLKSVGKNALRGIQAKAKIKVPKKQLTKYKKLFKGKGQKNTVSVTG